MNDHPAHIIAVPEGHAAIIFRVPARQEDDRDDATKILDSIAGTPRGVAPHVASLIDHDERNDIDG